MAINLLPTYLTPKSGAFKINNFLKTTAIASLAITVVLGFLFLALFLINLLQINSITKKNNVLKENVKNLEQTEQRYVLVKDRISKSKQIISDSAVYEKVQSISNVITASSGVNITELNVSSTTVEFSITTSTTGGITTFSKNLLADKSFKKINITEFNFSPSTGYTITYQIL